MVNEKADQTSSVSRREYMQAAAAAGTVGLTGLAGCSGGSGSGEGGETTSVEPSTESGEKTLTLGAAISKTGELATEGQLYVDSYKMTVQDINEKGGVKVGDTTYKLGLKIYDDQSDPAKSRQLFQKLIESDGINYLLGPYSSGVTLAAKPIVLKNKVPMVQGGGASMDIFFDQNWIFGTLAPAPGYATTPMSLADTFSDPAVDKVAIATQNGNFSKSARDYGAIPKAEELGWEVAVDETFPKDTDDLSSILNKVKGSGANMMLMLGHYKHATLLAKQMKQYDVNVPFTAASVGVTPNKFIKEVGATGNYFTGPSQWDSSASYDGFFYGSAPDYVKRFKNRYDYSPDYHNAAASAQILTYFDAFQRTDELGPKAVRDAIEKTNFNSFYGGVKFSSVTAKGKTANGVIDRDMFLYQWQDQQKKLIYPDSVARAEPAYPAPKWSSR